MKSSFFKGHKINLTSIGYFTLIVYFIAAFSGWVNFYFSILFDKVYYPLRSYLIPFDKKEIVNFDSVNKSIFNFSGFGAVIHADAPYKLIDDIFFTFISFVLVVLFLLGYKAVKSNKASQIEIIKYSVIFSLFAAISIPTHSSDLYGYIARGAQQSVHKQNPYIQTVSKIEDYRNDPLFLNFMWPSTPTTYGPVFIYLSKAIVQLSNNDFLLSFLNFKLMNLTIFFLALLVLVKTNNTVGLYLIAWNPLILIQGLWNAHNDLISGVLICVGIYFLSKNEKAKLNENIFWSAFCLVLAIGIKYVSILILPFLFIYALRAKDKIYSLLYLLVGLLCGLILTAIFSVDYIAALDNLSPEKMNKLVNNVGLVHKSFIATIYVLTNYTCKFFNTDCNLSLIRNLLRCCFYFIFVIFYISVFLRRRENLILDIVLILFVFFGFTIAKFHSWYLLNVVFLLPFLPKGTLRSLLIAFSITHTFAITFLDQAKIANFLFMTLLPTIYILTKKKK